MNQTRYEKKRNEMYSAYQIALEMENMDEATRLFKEYEHYKAAAEREGVKR